MSDTFHAYTLALIVSLDARAYVFINHLQYFSQNFCCCIEELNID